jgi:hypothetical protein
MEPDIEILMQGFSNGQIIDLLIKRTREGIQGLDANFIKDKILIDEYNRAIRNLQRARGIIATG